MQLFDKLGFRWDRSAVPADVPASVDRAIFLYKQMLAQFVFDASSLEGNPFTFPEVKTLLDGVTVGGHKLTDEQQVLNLAAAARDLFTLVKAGSFRLDKATFDRLHALVAREEPLEWGYFRGEGEFTDITPRVGLGYEGEFVPSHPTEPGAENLKKLFADACASSRNRGRRSAQTRDGLFPVWRIAAILFRRKQAHIALHDERRSHVAWL